MGMTITEKILARHSSRKEVHAGDLVECDISTAALVELTFSGGRRTRKVWDPEKVWLFGDHSMPSHTVVAANDMVQLRRFAAKTGIKNVMDGQGISHVVLSEKGGILPGTVLANVDSHTASVGALNCAGRGIGNVDM
jgi:homoaconitase/3-isopropylmalate dehydratase large subunit